MHKLQQKWIEYESSSPRGIQTKNSQVITELQKMSKCEVDEVLIFNLKTLCKLVTFFFTIRFLTKQAILPPFIFFSVVQGFDFTFRMLLSLINLQVSYEIVLAIFTFLKVFSPLDIRKSRFPFSKALLLIYLDVFSLVHSFNGTFSQKLLLRTLLISCVYAFIILQ